MDKVNVLYEIKSLECMIAKDFFNKIFDEKDIPKTIPTPTQMRIIEYILKNNDKEIYQKDLEKVFNLTRATISGVLQTMERNNLIIRATSKKDSRTKVIKLSNKTYKIFEENKKRLALLENFITRGIDNREIDNFIKTIDKMKGNLEYLSINCNLNKEDKNV